MNASQKTKKAVAKYGINICREAYKLSLEGNGASSIGIDLGLTTNQADAAINAGRELAK